MSRLSLAGIALAAAAGVVVGQLGNSPGALAAANDLIATGPGPGGSANVRTFAANGTKSGDVDFTANGTPTSGVSVATGDVNADGVPEIITGTGPGVEAQVQVWSKDGSALVAQRNPFPGFNGGISVAAVNLDETNGLEVVVGAGPGGGPHVKVLRLTGGQLVDAYSFFAYDGAFRGGVNVAGASGRLVVGPGAGGGPHVRVYRFSGGQPMVDAEWMAYDPAFNGGVNVAAGAFRSPASIDVITGAGPGGGPHVRVFALDGTAGPGLFAYNAAFRGGVAVGVGNGQRLITGAGPGGGPHVLVMTFGANKFTTTASFFAYAADFSGGVRVAGFPLTILPPTTTTSCTGIPPLCLPGGGTTTTRPTTTTTRPTTTTSSTTTSSTSTSTSTTTTQPG